MPAYSKLQANPAALRNAYLRTLSLVMFVVMPATFGLITVARPLVQVLFGARWLEAVQPLQILAAFGLVRALASFAGYLFEGMGLPRVAFVLGLLRLAVLHGPLRGPLGHDQVVHLLVDGQVGEDVVDVDLPGLAGAVAAVNSV